ncbi:MAG: DNA (cytosine-5-)-methyltransferase [Dehalococcoidia bacterium]|nr:DNA (cytosine-5-)-methyltransferase [Dehalococcoidia bacterium]
MTDVPAFLELFAGIGGFAYGLERAGFCCAGQVELDPFCQRVLERRWPGVARWGDVRTLGDRSGPGGSELSAGQGICAGWSRLIERGIDLLVGGFPCQGASVAGKRLGLADDRTALFWEICRVQKIVQAPWALLENVPGLRSVRLGHDFPVVLAALKELWPVVGWRTLDSRFFNVAQRRERVFFVCGPDEARVAAVLFEPEGGGGDSAAGGEAVFARSLTVGAGGSGLYDDQETLVVAHQVPTHGTRYDPSGQDFVVGALGCDKERGWWRAGPDEAAANQLVVAQCHGSNVGPMGALRKGSGNVTSGVPFVATTLPADNNLGSRRDQESLLVVTRPLKASAIQEVGRPARVQALSVRRLTPTEAERLQAFPDGWTCLCLPLDEWARDPEDAAERCACPDSPRYRALGNAVTTTAVEWIAHRLRAAMG